MYNSLIDDIMHVRQWTGWYVHSGPNPWNVHDAWQCGACVCALLTTAPLVVSSKFSSLVNFNYSVLLVVRFC